MKTEQAWSKHVLSAIGAFALLMLTAAGTRAELIVTGDFPIGQTVASQLKQDLVFDLLMAEYEADTAFLDGEDLQEDLFELWFRISKR